MSSGGGLSWQVVALVLGTAGASTGGSYAVQRVSKAGPVELEERVKVLEEAGHKAEVSQASRDAHLDEQLQAIRAQLAELHELVKVRR